MIGLKSTRVIVIDDEEREALPIMKALAKKCIPCAYFHGANIKELPEETDKFTGIRLAILDMDLVGSGADDKSKVTTLVSLLEKLLSPDNGPYIVIAWTKHTELLELFEEYVFSNQAVPNPISIITLTKDQCEKPNGDFDVGVIETKLDEILRAFSPLKLIQAWEGKNFEAATEVTNILSTFITDEKNPEKWRETWKVQLLNLMFSLAKEAIGESLDKNTVLGGLYSSLNPLHSDRMESYVSELAALMEADGEAILECKEGCDTESKAKINTMLHLALEERSVYGTGNIYMFESDKVPTWGLSHDNLLIDLANREEYSNAEKRGKISLECKYILIETSASCDHAQGNIRAARFLSGFIVPEAAQNKLKKPKEKDSSFIWSLGPLFIEKAELKGIYYLYFSARHLVTCSPDEASAMKPFARLRSQALMDLQSWFARHASRPGLILLHDI